MQQISFIFKKLGERFAVCQIKCGLVEILRRYRIEVYERTMIPYEIKKSAFMMTPKDGIWLKFLKREWFFF